MTMIMTLMIRCMMGVRRIKHWSHVGYVCVGDMCVCGVYIEGELGMDFGEKGFGDAKGVDEVCPACVVDGEDGLHA